MTRRLIAVAACGGALLIGAPVAGADKGGKPNGGHGHANGGKSVAAKACTAEKKADKAAFKERWGKHAMRECLRSMKGELSDEAKNAAHECKAERAEDPDAFRETYGTNKNGKNAFGKCVSEKVREDTEEPTS